MSERSNRDMPQTRAEEIRQQLADGIVRGRLPPGLPLDESEIARHHGVSRTPVREAIRQLEATGLAEARPRRGAVVAAVTKDRLDQMFFMMLELEALCAREAARAMSSAERLTLKRLHDAGTALVASAEIEGYARHNLAFHDSIYAGAKNGFLAETTLGVRKRLAPFRRAQFFSLGRLAGSHAEHGAVVDAILRADDASAAAAMRGHISSVRVSYATLVPEFGAEARVAAEDAPSAAI